MKKNIIFGIIGLIVLIGGIIGGIFLVNQNQDFREKAAPETSLFVSPATQTKSQSENFSFTVEMNTSTNLVTGVDVRLNFDPNLVEILSLQKGSGISNFDSTITNDFNNTSGTISYAVFTIDKTKAVTGSNLQVLTVNGKVKSNATAGTARFNFNSSTSASGVNEGQNILIGKTAGSLVVSGGQATNNPTQAPTATSTSASGSNSTANPNSTATSTSKATGGATATSKSTNTSIPTNKSSSVPIASGTPFPVPVTGDVNTTIISAGLGIFVLIASLMLAF